MHSDYLIERLISAMTRLSDQELRELVDLFRYGNASEVFGEVVERMIYLRRIEREKRLETTRDESQFSRQPATRSSTPMSEPVKRRFFALLNNRTLFASTKDVVDVLNDVFNLGLRYEDYQRQGRRDLIHKCWRHLEQMPSDQRKKVLRALSQRRMEHAPGSEGYHELFRILSQR